MFQSVRLSAVIGIVFFACLSFWPALDEEHSDCRKGRRSRWRGHTAAAGAEVLDLEGPAEAAA